MPITQLLKAGAIFLIVATMGLARAEVDFARDIQPILNANCVECHGGVKAAGGVSFVYEEQVINFESESGSPVVTPHDLDNSEMFYRITEADEDDFMPPGDEHAPLSPREINLIKQWIKEGAKWSGHWAFAMPTHRPAPNSTFEDLAKGEIDRYLFARLDQEGLKPSPLEEPGRLLRRLSLALIGLPPTLDELDAFESAYAKDPDQTLEQTVNALMARPAFGERWTSMWLDLVRYADSRGLGQDQKRTIWAYRDWVVNAFNDGMPFDEFTIKQLAGDLIPNPTTADLVATACHRNTQTNDEGGTDDEAFRIEAVIDRVNTTWQTWGSITFGCVQCHDHPYDPIRHTEYYQFMDFFNNTADSDLPTDGPLVRVPRDPTDLARADQLRRQILELKKEIWKDGVALKNKTNWKSARSLSVTSQNNTKYRVKQHPDYAEFYTTGTLQTNTTTQIQVPSTGFPEQPVTALRLTVLPLHPAVAKADSEWGFMITKVQSWTVTENGTKTPVSFRWSVADVPWMPTAPMKSIKNDGVGWGADSRIHGTRELVLVPKSPLKIPKGSHFELHLECKKTGHRHPMVIKRGRFASTSDLAWNSLGSTTSNQYSRQQSIAKQLRELSNLPGSNVPVMQDRPTTIARPTHVFVRGNSMDKETLVTAGFPASMTTVAPAPDQANFSRLDMANWWVSDNHPLTARVFVNRLWEQLFGTGIVLTLEDFGSSGESPEHRELLDYLAIRFQKDYSWDVKAILREMASSYAFQQSSRVSAELLKKDPANRLIARGPRLRLSAEAVRDQALSVSGLLSLKRGGPPVHPPMPNGVWRPFQKKEKWTTSPIDREDRYRRAIYTYVKRSIPFPAFATFDAPSREFCNPRRLSSNTPLQALTTLNDPAFVECAEALGRRIETEFSGSLEDRLSKAHRLITARNPAPKRLDHLIKLHNDLAEQTKEIWTVVAQVLLNLDEALTY